MGRTRNQIINEATDDYLAKLNPNNLPTPEDAERELVNLIEDDMLLENQARPKGNKLRIPAELDFEQIAKLMALYYPIARISCAGPTADPEYDLLALYCEQGENEGTYVTSEEVFRKLAMRFNRRLTSDNFKEMLSVLKIYAPRKTRCMNPNLIAVNNGIFNYDTKELKPFDPDYVFMTKSHVNYNDQATNIIIHNSNDNSDWDIESWMRDLSDDPEIVELLWEILGAVIRPHVPWDKSAWLYSETGNNGKGTYCALARNICGATAYATIPLNDFSKDFALEPLIHATAVIVDENDVGTFIDKAANLKAIITNDAISINRKFKTPITYQFYGFMIQCLNEFPRIKDRSDSFYRRQLFIPFDKCFTGVEKPYIKNDYLNRQEVLEYVLYKVLNMNYYRLSEPARCKNVLEEYKEFNDPVRQFWDEMEPEFAWDLLPFSFLYDLYKLWFRRNSPSGTIQGKTKFIQELLNVVTNDPEWYCADKNSNIRSSGRMSNPEPLIAIYDVTTWMNPNYVGSDPNKIGQPALKSFYRGLLRTSAGGGNLTTGGDADEDTD